MTTLLITGATRGLGLETARAARERGVHVLLSGRDEAATRAIASSLRAEPVVLDLASLDQVRAVAARLPPVDVLACNAGLQVIDGSRPTADGFDETFQVNHLAHLALIDALLARPAPPRRIALVGSATHDPAVWSGTPDPLEGPLAAVARPVGDTEGVRTAGLRRYATSKLYAAATAGGLAREHPGVHVTCFDPGLMPGTGLARQQPAPLRALWATAMKGLRVLPFASSPAGSGRAFAALLTQEPPPVPSGAYVDHRGRAIAASARASDPAYQDAVLRDSRALLAAAVDAAIAA